MTLYLISYDLRKPNQDYEELFSAIKSFSGYYHLLESAWLVSTGKNAQGVYDILRPHTDDNDHIFVSSVNSSDRQGWIPKGAWEWIKNN